VRLFQLVIIPLLIFAACAAFLMSGLDASRFWTSWERVDYWYLLVALCLAIFNLLGLGLRLRFLSSGKVEFASGCQAAVLGLTLNVLLPAKLGELAKIGFLSRRSRLSLSESSTIVFWERFFDLNMVLAIVLLAIAVGLPPGVGVTAFAVLLGIWFGLAALKQWPVLADTALALFPPGRIKHYFENLFLHLRQGLSVRRVLGAAACSLLPWLVYAAQVFFILSIGLVFDLTFAQELAVFLAAVFSTSVPSTPGSVGVYEAAVVAVLMQFGVDKETALGAAIMMHGMQLVPALLGGLWAFKLAPSLYKASK
jgi:uncharacterized membrane protein YbhN (UPF0104 family)